MLYFPTLGELAWLVFSCLLVCGLGYLAILPRWNTRESLPVWYSLSVGLVALIVYSMMTVSMMQRHHSEAPQSLEYVMSMLELEGGSAPADGGLSEEGVMVAEQNARARLVTLLVWIVAFWIPPAVVFGRLFLNSIAAQTVRAIPFTNEAVSQHVAEEFKVARQLYENGDIRGALRVYRNYPQNRQGAWMEAGKMLEAEALYVDAVEHYQDMIDLFGPTAKCWPEATYRLAMLLDQHLNKPSEARDLLMSVYQRAPRSEFGHMAETSLQGLTISSADLLAQLDAGFEKVRQTDNTTRPPEPTRG